MSLLITKGISKCNFSTSSLKRLFVANWIDLTGGLIIQNDVIQDITPTLAWFEFDLIKSKAELIENSSDTDNGIRYSQIVNYYISTLDTDSQQMIIQLLNSRAILLIQDSNSRYWLIGRYKGVEVKQNSSKIGGENGYSFSFLADSLELMKEVASSYYTNNILYPDCGASGLYTDPVLVSVLPMWQILNCPVYP